MTAVSSATYCLHGILVRSDVALEEPLVESRPADVEIRRGESRFISGEVPAGEAVIRLSTHDRVWYAASHTGDGYILRFPSICDFAISEDLSSITWHPHEGIDESLIEVILKGTLLSFVLNLRGHFVLHASAVSIDNTAVAFAGLSGMGKSTTAALLCAGGAHLITDDALRVEFGPPIVCFRGTSTLRLRQSAAPILDLFETRPRIGETPDGRLAVYPPTRDGSPTLSAIVVPYPDRGIEHASVEPVFGAEAFWTMSRFGRVMGWQQQAMIQQQFSGVSELVAEGRVLRLRIPWNRPFTGQVIDELRQVILQSVR